MAIPEVEPLPAARTIALAIAAALRADITAGRLRAGDRLLQTELTRRCHPDASALAARCRDW